LHFRRRELVASSINHDRRRSHDASNQLLSDGGVSYRGSVGRRHRANRNIAFRNQAHTCGIDRNIESAHIDASRDLDQSSVGSGEKGVGQRHNQMG
jgi:hypothetical protein